MEKEGVFLTVVKKENLDTRICDVEEKAANTETYRQFIESTELEFGLIAKDLDGMNEHQLNDYLTLLDDLWMK